MQERQLGDMNKQLKIKVSLELSSLQTEGQGLGPLPCSWNPTNASTGNTSFSVHPSQPNPMDCDNETVLQIGYMFKCLIHLVFISNSKIVIFLNVYIVANEFLRQIQDPGALRTHTNDSKGCLSEVRTEAKLSLRSLNSSTHPTSAKKIPSDRLSGSTHFTSTRKILEARTDGNKVCPSEVQKEGSVVPRKSKPTLMKARDVPLKSEWKQGCPS
ncbi:hypothetical protein TEA_000088 [Camellia sinensis var. sinensis]|uniref:Uncharacterized protein n=1 Tax=Camellia sinensis var. sinensis TaxID=542762 RepID=A0A4V6RYB1_CAMSN|nr:hypothetical protein TEA_000088 [Camellia sinensis var. sinensis]